MRCILASRRRHTRCSFVGQAEDGIRDAQESRKQKTAYEMLRSLVGSEVCIRDRLYSHLGSRGIVVLTILQSYAQGVGVWGETGMKALWSLSLIHISEPTRLLSR